MKLKPVTGRARPRRIKRARERGRTLVRHLMLEQLEQKRLLAVFTVDSVADQVDQNPGDGLCLVANGGGCTLRAAVMEANAWGTSLQPDRVVLPAGEYFFSLAGNGNLAGDLDITQSMVLVGAGSASTAVDASGLDRVFDIRTGSVEIRGLTIRGGVVDDTEALLDGTGGGVRNEGTLLIADSVVTGNRATRGAGIGNYNGTLSVQRSVITGNGDAATQSGGGIENYSYYDPASISVMDSTVSENRASSGGGINNHAYDGLASAVITGSTISGNNAELGGGVANRAVYYAEQGAHASLSIVGSTISGNVGSTSGGGIHSQATTDSTATLAIRNSTIARNTAAGGPGGGVHVIDSAGTSTTLNSVLVSGNSSVGSGQDLEIASLSASHTLVETTGGHNLVHAANDNLVGVDALLVDLADNGGLTLSHAVASGSPAIDQGANLDGLYGDQRGSGFARTVDDGSVGNAGDGTDIGSIEMGQVGAVFDFGDAPESILVGGTERFYPSQLSSDGARHQVVTGGPKLGTVAADPEPDAFPVANASGDDLVGFDDEDGIAAEEIVLTPGSLMQDVILTHDAGINGAFLNVWIDLNMDGDWSDAGEHVVDDTELAAGVSSTSLAGMTVPAEIATGTTFLRARISTESGLGTTGAAIDGEVEDFALAVGSAPTQVADLSLTNVVIDSNPQLNDTASFIVTVVNSGPVAATGIEISALLPFELYFETAQASVGAYDDFDGVWLVDQLLPGQSASLQVNAIVETTDPVSFTAEVVASDQLDLDSTPGNGISSEDDQATSALGTCLAAAPLHVGLNRLRYACSSPGAFTGFVRGSERGLTTFSDYQVTVDIANAEQMAIGIADANGVSEVFFELDEASIGEPLLVQAFEMFPAKAKGNTLSLGETEQFLHAVTVGAGGESLQQEVIQPSLIQALMAWHASGADARELRQLAGVSVTISDLPGNVLARTAGRTIVLDHDAAGNGWFVDPSPWDHVEFGGTRAAGWTQGAGYATSRVAADRIDLLTTLTHEFGHLLGMDDLRQVNHVMNHELEVGRRVLPEASQTDAHGFDINRDDRVSSLDALVVINQLSTQSVLKADGRFWHGHQDLNWLPFDTNLDGYLSTIDVLGVLNHLSSIQASEGEAEQLQNGFSVGYECTPAIDVDFVHAEITRDGVVQTLRLDTGIDVAPALSDGLGFRFNAWKQPGSYRAGSAPQRSQGVERGALVTGSGIASLTDVDLSMAQGMTPDEIIQARLA
ncbi:MAG: choice-of-anchor Q domain-containing protein [Rubripirellula sp.]